MQCKTGENRTQVDRLVLDGDEPEENSASEPWKWVALSSHNEQIRQLLVHRQQLEQQRTDIQKCLAVVKEELMSNDLPGNNFTLTTRTADPLQISRDKNPGGTDLRSPRIKSLAGEYVLSTNFRQIRKLREEYLKHGGKHSGVLEQMRSMEIEAKLKGDKEQTHKKLLKKNDKPYQEPMKTQLQQTSHKLINRSFTESMEDQSQILMQQILRLESENQHLQSQLNTLLPQVPQIKDDQSLKDTDKKHQQELLLLQQKIEIVKRQKELNQHEKELHEIIGSHTQKPVQQFMATPNITSNRYILPSRNEMVDLYINCDFISGLPPDITQCHVILHPFSESSMVRMEGIPMSPVTCTLKSNSYRKGSANISYEGFASIGKKQQIPSYLHCPNLSLVVEIQVHQNTASASESPRKYFRTQAWTKINLLDVHLQPLIGKFFVPLKILPIVAKMSKSQFDTLPQFWKAQFYYQICYKSMMPDPLDIINTHLYTPAYQAQGYYPKTRHKLPPPPPTATPPDFEDEEYRYLDYHDR